MPKSPPSCGQPDTIANMGRSSKHHCCESVLGLVRLFELIVPILISADHNSQLVIKVVEAFRLAHTADLQSKKSDNLKSQKQTAKAKAKTPSDKVKSKTKPGTKAPAKVKSPEKASDLRVIQSQVASLKSTPQDNLKSQKQKTPAKASAEAKVAASAKTAKTKEKVSKPAVTQASSSSTKETVVKPKTDKVQSKTKALPTELKPLTMAPSPIPDFNEQHSEYSKRYPFLTAAEIYLCFVHPNQNMLGALRKRDMPQGLDKAGQTEWRQSNPLYPYLHRLIPSLPDRSSSQKSTETLKNPQPSPPAKGKQPEVKKSDKVKSVSTTGPSQPVTSPAVTKSKSVKALALTPLEWRAKLKALLDEEQFTYYVCLSTAEQRILLSAPDPLRAVIELWAASQH